MSRLARGTAVHYAVIGFGQFPKTLCNRKGRIITGLADSGDITCVECKRRYMRAIKRIAKPKPYTKKSA